MKCIVRVARDYDGRIILQPSNEQAEAEFEKLRMASDYKMDLRKARNPDHHRKGFALIKLIFDSQERFRSMDAMLTELKIKTGWYHEHITADGKLVYVPKSIAFESMDQTTFETFYDKLIDVAIQDYGLEQAVEFV